jgi:hypothetical protein
MDAAPGLSPRQVRVLDGEMLRTGRVNGTEAAQETTAEPVLILRDPALAAQDAQHGDAPPSGLASRPWAEACASDGKAGEAERRLWGT